MTNYRPINLLVILLGALFISANATADINAAFESVQSCMNKEKSPECRTLITGALTQAPECRIVVMANQWSKFTQAEKDAVNQYAISYMQNLKGNEKQYAISSHYGAGIPEDAPALPIVINTLKKVGLHKCTVVVSKKRDKYRQPSWSSPDETLIGTVFKPPIQY